MRTHRGGAATLGTGGNPTITARDIGSGAEAVDFEIDEFQSWRDGLNPAELRAAQEYALDSTRLNAYIRGDGPPPPGVNAAQRIRELDAAISHPLSTGLTVYRGVGTDYLGLNLTSESAVKALIGKTIRDSAYLSTAMTREVGETYARGGGFSRSAPQRGRKR